MENEDNKILPGGLEATYESEAQATLRIRQSSNTESMESSRRLLLIEAYQKMGKS